MESLDDRSITLCVHEPRIGAFPGAAVGRLESRPSEQRFMESPPGALPGGSAYFRRDFAP